MKISFGLFVAAVTAMSANALKANSDKGKGILSQARKLDENEANLQWVADYSLKFQGCHHVYQWNQEVDEDEDVRLYAKRLARFRLCPSDECSTSLSGGCESGFGDYVIDMSTYVNAYYATYREQLEEECENFQENMCADCDGNDDEYNCYYNCLAEANMQQCVEFLEDENNQEQEEFDVEEYLECAQWNPPENDNERRRLEDEEEEVQYYIGPYCSGQGGSVNMGLFTDDTCTTFADEEGGAYTFKTLAGYSLPFSGESIVGEECFSCLTPNYEQEDEDNNDDGEAAEVEINEACQTAYTGSGKCEYNLAEGTVSSPENSSCNYIDGIKIIREDGMVLYKPEHPNAVATAFIVVFAMAFASMGFYVWYLRTRLGIKSNTLL